MIDITDPEGRISFAELAGLLPPDAGGRKIRLATLVRYATRGRRGVKLDAARVGRGWYTTREAANAFFSARERPKSAEPTEPSPALVRATQKAEALGL